MVDDRLGRLVDCLYSQFACSSLPRPTGRLCPLLVGSRVWAGGDGNV